MNPTRVPQYTVDLAQQSGLNEFSLEPRGEFVYAEVPMIMFMSSIRHSQCNSRSDVKFGLELKKLHKHEFLLYS